MILYKTYAVSGGKIITLYEAARILAKAMQPIYNSLMAEEGYMYEDVAGAAERNAIEVTIEGEDFEE